ncbi:MAG: beta-mannanase, partial [Armatimonadetes bacterium]|nr:beta-mannanase [Armatimonadota bacterium]
SREAVCILTEDQDHWGAAHSAFLLAKQAGFDLEFQYHDQPIKEALLYLLPSICGHGIIRHRRRVELLEKVAQGATLYISMDTGLPSNFEAITGLEPQTRERRRDDGAIRLEGLSGKPEIPSGGTFKIRFRPTRADVLGVEPDGNPAFTIAEYGKGKVFFLSVPIETMAAQTPGAFHEDDAPPYWRIYHHIAQGVLNGRAVRKRHPFLSLTEHPLSHDRRVVVAANLSPGEVEEMLSLGDGWTLSDVHIGRVDPQGQGRLACSLRANDGAVFEVAKQ